MATPSEAAAIGVLTTVIVAVMYKGLTVEIVKQCLWSTLSITVMIFMIILGSEAFSRILSFSGASAQLSEFVIGQPLAPIAMVIAIQLLLLVLGMFMGAVPMIMITMPIFMPIVLN
ncbi:TRAP transporter large permease subunit, partial [Chloroflexota bacterium]